MVLELMKLSLGHLNGANVLMLLLSVSCVLTICIICFARDKFTFALVLDRLSILGAMITCSRYVVYACNAYAFKFSPLASADPSLPEMLFFDVLEAVAATAIYWPIWILSYFISSIVFLRSRKKENRVKRKCK